jgi:hypothetical protein
MRTLWKITIALKKCTKDTTIYPVVRSRVALNPSQVIQRSNLSTTVFLLISSSFYEESPQVGVSHALHN